MQRRPQCRIGKTFIVAAVMRGRQIEFRQRTGAQCFNFGKWFLLEPVTDATGRTDPNRAGILHYRQQGSREPTRHGLIGLAARNAIRNDDEVHRVPSCWSAPVNNHSSIWFLTTVSTK